MLFFADYLCLLSEGSEPQNDSTFFRLDFENGSLLNANLDLSSDGMVTCPLGLTRT